MHTVGHVLSPSNCTHFSLSIMKSPWNMTHFIMVLKYYVHCYYTARVTNCEDKSLYFYLQNYTFKYILIYYHCTVVLILFCYWNVISSLTLYGWNHKSYKEQSDVVQLESETYKISQNLFIFKITLLSIH